MIKSILNIYAINFFLKIKVGLFDLEDQPFYKFSYMFFLEENYCLPIGIGLGAAGGLLNELFR